MLVPMSGLSAASESSPEACGDIQSCAGEYDYRKCCFGSKSRLSIAMNSVIVARTFCHHASADHHGRSSDDPAMPRMML
jgi:hypothetical protein